MEQTPLFRLAALLIPVLATVACDGTSATGGSGGTGAAGGGGTGATGGAGGTGGAAPAKTTIAFGSCIEEDKPKPVLTLAAESTPDLFIFLGDNIYGDTVDMAVLQSKYD